MFRFKNILVPTDFSEDAERALRVALQMAVKDSARVFLLHVVSRMVRYYVSAYCRDPKVAEHVANESILVSSEMLQGIVDRCPATPHIRIIPDLRKGEPYEEILKEAAERRIDLIVIAPHGKSGWKKCRIGSVVERVLQAAQCPVLLVHGKEKKEVSACTL